MGTGKLLKFHQKHYDPNYDKRIPIFDINTMIRKKKKGVANVIIEKLDKSNGAKGGLR